MKYIDETTWERRDISALFSNIAIPFYSVTTPVDVTALYRYCKRHSLSFYHGMMYCVLSACNAVPAFLYKLRKDGVVKHDYLSPSFTYPRENDSFGIVNVEWQDGEDMASFCQRCKRAQDAALLLPPIPSDEEEARDDFVYISCIPWFTVTHVTQEMSLDINESIPRLLWDKMVEKDERRQLSLIIQVNHRLIDGKHIHLFLQELNATFLKLEEAL
ncbi:MAG: CatA-like O-acetyltransferase [Clostridia bacterium]|nr:CatA-like O-acetyltransferase [Clostridia bacterium]